MAGTQAPYLAASADAAERIPVHVDRTEGRGGREELDDVLDELAGQGVSPGWS